MPQKNYYYPAESAPDASGTVRQHPTPPRSGPVEVCKSPSAKRGRSKKFTD